VVETISIVGLSFRGGYVETQHRNDELRSAATIRGCNDFDRSLSFRGGYVETQHRNDELRSSARICGYNDFDRGLSFCGGYVETQHRNDELRFCPNFKLDGCKIYQ
jgi:hypothetical protein